MSENLLNENNQGSSAEDILSTIKSPADLKNMDIDSLKKLAQNIRDRIINVTSVNGGHVGPNLGVVELTIALHKVFDTPFDKITFDVSHQSYVHKLLTGRNGKEFDKIRQTGGLCGFTNRKESPHDSFGAGHAGTAISSALGMAKARDLKETNECIISVVGDAALTCGISLEALNNISSDTKKFIVILNDNKMSIAKNVGAMSKYLNDLITNPIYNKFHSNLESLLKKTQIGKKIADIGKRAGKEAKDFMLPTSLFEKFNLRYLGPVDGHDLESLIGYLEFCKETKEPILLHVLTEKGRGLQAAIDNPEKFHGASPYFIESGLPRDFGKPNAKNWQDIFGEALARFALTDEKVVGITAAMPSGTGLCNLKKAISKRFFDVGIAEEHAAVFAAGMATEGFHPVCAIYSSFTQRAFDCIMHDICLQDLPVTFCMDRAGLSPQDGATHHGLYDIAFLRILPNTIIMQPKDDNELVDMLYTCLNTEKPTFIRYPRGPAMGVKINEEPTVLEIGKAELLQSGEKLSFWALGNFVDTSMQVAKLLEEKNSIKPTVVNARFAKPLDVELLIETAKNGQTIVTFEDHTIEGGFGSAVMEKLSENNLQNKVIRIAWPDKFVHHGSSQEILREEFGLSIEKIYEKIISNI